VLLNRVAAPRVTEALLVRRGFLFASGRSAPGSAAIRLRNQRRLHPGRYTLILIQTAPGGRAGVTRSTVRIG
jgi:hypothetical protein